MNASNASAQCLACVGRGEAHYAAPRWGLTFSDKACPQMGPVRLVFMFVVASELACKNSRTKGVLDPDSAPVRASSRIAGVEPVKVPFDPLEGGGIEGQRGVWSKGI